jgi:hypothetical protein
MTWNFLIVCLAFFMAIFSFGVIGNIERRGGPGSEGAVFVTTLLMFIFALIGVSQFWRASGSTKAVRAALWLESNVTRGLRSAKTPPILYLRSFDFDEKASKSSFLQRLTFGGDDIETSLIRRLSRYAPVLAIGRPGEANPQLGAMRFYVTEERWQQVIQSLIPFCSLVIWTTGRTSGLRWEIEQLVRNISPRRLLLWLHLRVGSLTSKQRNEEWRALLSEYDGIFPRPLPQKVGSARFIAFDDNWNPLAVPGKQFPRSLFDLLEGHTSILGINSFAKARLGNE